MALNPIPPQAYTKDTLQKAYSWLLSQGPEIKEMASTQDILVSLYLQATRNGAESLERPSIQNFRTELKTLADQLGNFDTGKKTAASKAPKAASTAAPRASDYVTEQRPLSTKTSSAYSTATPEMPAGITPEQLKQALAAVYEATLATQAQSGTPQSGAATTQNPPQTYAPAAASAEVAAPATSATRIQNAIPPLKQGTAISEKIVEERAFVTPTFEIAGLDAESLRKITEVQAILNLSTHHEAIRALIAIGYKKLKLGLE